MARRKASKFFVNERREVIEGLFIAIGPLNQQLRDVVGCRHVIENTAPSLWKLYTRSACLHSQPGFRKRKVSLMIDF